MVGAAFLKKGAVVAGLESGELLLWYPRTDAVRRTEQAFSGKLELLKANRQGTMIAGAEEGGRIHLFDDQGAKIGELPPAEEPALTVTDLLFSPDGKTLAAI